MFFKIENSKNSKLKIQIKRGLKYQVEEVCPGDSCESEEEGEGLEVDVEVAEGVADRAAAVVLRLAK